MLRYIKIGTGPKVMIAFHGFGRDASMFKNYKSVFPEYTLYSISLFYHGSEWAYPDHLMDEKRWKFIFGNFLAYQGIHHFSLLGFSLGGKMALYTFQLFSHQVHTLHLIAPYGIKSNIVEWLTQKIPFVYRKLEKYVHQPQALMSLLALFRKYKLMNPTLLNIIFRQMDSLEKRSRAYYSMLLYGTLRLNLKDIREKLEKFGVRITFYLGRYDQVLPLQTLHQYISVQMNFSLHIFPTGHTTLPKQVVHHFAIQSDMLSSSRMIP